MTESKPNSEPSEAQKFDAVVRKVLSVSHKELERREKAWQRQRQKKKLAKATEQKKED